VRPPTDQSNAMQRIPADDQLLTLSRSSLEAGVAAPLNAVCRPFWVSGTRGAFGAVAGPGCRTFISAWPSHGVGRPGADAAGAS
jgi:hypothetical protein